MERIVIFKRTTKKEGVIKLRFRLRDGRNIDLYHKSDIEADLKSLEKFTLKGTVKPKVTVYDKNLLADISKEIEAMSAAYAEMKDKGVPFSGENFEAMIDKILHPDKYVKNEAQTLLERFGRFIENGYRDGIFGEGRMKHYYVVYHELERFLIINKMDDVTPKDFSADALMDLGLFFRDEYLYVDKWRGLYVNVNTRNTPMERRSMNTVATKMKKIQAFFNELEDKEEIVKSPFRKLGRERKRNVLKEKYDDPVYLKRDEFLKLMRTEVPSSLQETKEAFLLQCAFGCRIADFQALTMAKVAVRDGIPYIHYLPKKTLREQKDEIETPIMRYALDTVLKWQFKFPVLKYVSGKSGYNAKIKQLLRFVGIDRKCTVFDEDLDNTYKSLWELASSKLCRKTHVDMMNKVQVNQYAAGLHSIGSDAVNRYTRLELRDRFLLMCAAFGQPEYKVNSNLEIVEDNKL